MRPFPLLLLLAAVAAAGPTGKLQKKLGAVKAERAALERRLSLTRRNAVYTKQNLEAVDARLDRVEDGVRTTTMTLRARRKEAAILARRVTATRRDLVGSTAQVRRRLRAMYVQGGTAGLSAVLGTRSFAEIAQRKELMERIAAQDRRVFDRRMTLQRAALAQKRRKDDLVRETAALVAAGRARQTELVGAKLEKRAMLYGLAKRQEDLRRAIAAFDDEEARIAAEIARYTATVRATPGAALPAFSGGRLAMPNIGRVTSGFGWRIHPVLGTRRLHTGTDFAGGYGSPVTAAAAGRVVSAAWGGAYGNRVILDHGSGLLTMYGHMSRLYVGTGQMVGRGRPIGAIGSTGLSTGPHLHFEVWRNGAKVNPLSYLRR